MTAITEPNAFRRLAIVDRAQTAATWLAAAVAEEPATPAAADAAAAAPSAKVAGAALSLHQALLGVREKLGAAGVAAVIASLDDAVVAAANKALPLPVELGESTRAAYRRVCGELVGNEKEIKNVVDALLQVPAPPSSSFLAAALANSPLPAVPAAGRFNKAAVEEAEKNLAAVVRGRAEALAGASKFNDAVRAILPNAPREILLPTPAEPGNTLPSGHLGDGRHDWNQRGKGFDANNRTILEYATRADPRFAAVNKKLAALEGAVLARAFPAATDLAAMRARLVDDKDQPEAHAVELFEQAKSLVADALSFTFESGRRPTLEPGQRVHGSTTTQSNDHTNGVVKGLILSKHNASETSGSATTSVDLATDVRGADEAFSRIAVTQPLYLSSTAGNSQTRADIAVFAGRLALLADVHEALEHTLLRAPEAAADPAVRELRRFMREHRFEIDCGGGKPQVLKMGDARPGLLQLVARFALPPRYEEQIRDALELGGRVQPDFGIGGLASI